MKTKVTVVGGGNVLLYATASDVGGGQSTNVLGFTDSSGYNAAPVWITNFIAGVQSWGEALGAGGSRKGAPYSAIRVGCLPPIRKGL